MELTEKVKDFLDKTSNKLSLDFYEDVMSQFSDGDGKGNYIESPIEQMFYIEWFFRENKPNSRPPFNLEFQYQDETTGKYKIDFIVSFGIDAYFAYNDKIPFDIFKTIKSPQLGIELDGHVWHEKTKEQVQYHKERERFLVSNGWKLLRFTGSEIYKDTKKCVDEVLKISYRIRKDYFNKLTELISKQER